MCVCAVYAYSSSLIVICKHCLTPIGLRKCVSYYRFLSRVPGESEFYKPPRYIRWNLRELPLSFDDFLIFQLTNLGQFLLAAWRPAFWVARNYGALYHRLELALRSLLLPVAAFALTYTFVMFSFILVVFVRSWFFLHLLVCTFKTTWRCVNINFKVLKFNRILGFIRSLFA